MNCSSKYKIIKMIDQGSNGRIYMAKKKNKEFLIKVPIKKKEGKISKIMSDIVGPKIYDIYECNNKEINENGTFMVMEKLEGIDLNRYFEENDNIFINNDDILIKLLIDKIKKMHELNYCHNDLTSSNIFLIMKNNKILDIKIIDFGEAKIKTKHCMYNDYNTLYNSIITFAIHIIDNIEPLILEIEENMEKYK